jgi:hypothetical protein
MLILKLLCFVWVDRRGQRRRFSCSGDATDDGPADTLVRHTFDIGSLSLPLTLAVATLSIPMIGAAFVAFLMAPVGVHSGVARAFLATL